MKNICNGTVFKNALILLVIYCSVIYDISINLIVMSNDCIFLLSFTLYVSNIWKNIIH